MSPCGENMIGEEGKKLYDLISKEDVNGVKQLFAQDSFKVDLLDEHGMTPLKNAAYKGNKELVQFFLDLGADVNCKKHEHGYTALHFAALSGNEEVCQLLLEAGASITETNSVGRTPSQMAAFVGNHSCVVVINNYVPRAEIDYYTIPHGKETEPKLKPCYAPAVHKLILQVNLHPIRVALSLLPNLIEVPKIIQDVLEIMCEKEMKKGQESNEVMSFKLHYLAGIIKDIIRNKSEKNIESVELFIKKLLIKKRGEEYMDMLIREIVREFPFRDCTIFRQMVTTLANSKESLSALSVVTTALNGHRAFQENIKTCATCSEERASKKCSKCKDVQYCDRECQRLHWFIHKKECKRNSQSDPTAEITSKMENIKTN